MGVHILAPSVLNPAVGKGGTTLYRSVAAAAGRHAPTTVYEIAPPPAGSSRWASDGISVLRCATPAEVRCALSRRLRTGDTLLKWAGALGGGSDHDWVADLWTGELASTVGGVR